MKQLFQPGKRLVGKGRLSVVDPSAPEKRKFTSPYRHNDIMADWASIVSNFLVTGDSQFRISGMYLEFENTASPGDAVSIPTFQTTDGISYYNDLSSSPSRDYLRVFLSGANVSTSDVAQWPSGNVSQFFAMSTGVAGVHGKPYSDANNSTVFGGALVAIRDVGDPTKDLILSRLYYEADDQQVKLATSQIGMDWSIELQ